MSVLRTIRMIPTFIVLAGIMLVGAVFVVPMFKQEDESQGDRNVAITVDFEPAHRPREALVFVQISLSGKVTKEAIAESPLIKIVHLHVGDNVTVAADQRLGNWVRCIVTQSKDNHYEDTKQGPGSVLCHLVVM